MPSLSLLIDVARAYAALSPDGRAFLRKHRPRSEKTHTPESMALIENRPSRLGLFRSLKRCDVEFAASVPEPICAEAGRRRSAVYARFVPYAWISLELRTRLLGAYGITPDAGHDRQLILLTFVHREWNDWIDAVQPDILYRVLTAPDTPEPRFRLLRHVTGLSNALAGQRGNYEKMFEIWGKAMDYYRRPSRPGGAAISLEDKAAINEEIYARTLLPEISPGLSKILSPFYVWFLSLDDAADVERDRAAGRTTHMTLAADPAAEIRNTLRRCEETIGRTAPGATEPLLLLMRSMTADVVAAIREGRDLERDLFAGPDAAVIRNPSPSSPYRGGPA